jgi:pimeloyl-ACP methyl ester carboxylesterase/protein-tyrosine phosphatase
MGFFDNLWIDPGVLFVSLLVGSTVTAAAYAVWRDSCPSEDIDPGYDDDDPPLLKAHSSVQSYETPFANYEAVRIFYRPHTHKDKLQAIADLPLLVFIHGLGGSLSQFASLLGSLVNTGPCFGLDVPGHGLSKFSPQDFEAYETSALKVLWRTAISQACAEHGHKSVVLIGHSYGSSIAALLATDTKFEVKVDGIVAICPKATPPSQADCMKARLFLSLPDSFIDAFRWFDKRGGIDSKSVMRFVGQDAGIDLRKLQLKYNAASKTPVWKRMATGALPQYDAKGNAFGGLPGKETWSRLHVPLFLIAGVGDTVTKPAEITNIASFLHVRSSPKPVATGSRAIPTADTAATNGISSDKTASDTAAGTLPDLTTTSTGSSSVLKAATLPFPAGHALLYDHRTYRTLAGLIEDFLTSHISPHLSLGWQLQQLTTTGKWDVKNLEKWQKTQAVSGPIGPNNLFRALKTLREQDESHTPKKFVEQWRGKIYAVVDISHDAPIYSTRTLEEGGIQYHKFPTVSKIPPTAVEVRDFIALIDRLRTEMRDKGEEADGKAIAVHCHYGYNRTGFFVAAYLIEREGYGVQRALDEFREAKAPGIRHDHFVDALWVRYTVGLRRAETVEVEDSEG